MLKRRKEILLIFGLVAALALLAACASPTEKVTTPGAGTPILLPTKTPLPAEAKPIPGGVLQSSYSLDPAYWDPLMGVGEQTHVYLNRVHATLLQFYFGPGTSRWNFDIDGKGSLAESWEISADGLTYTFHLRKGVKWQNIPPMNGREFVAADVKWTLETHIATAGAPRREQLQVIKSVECPDKYTVVMQLKERRADMLLTLAGPYVEMLPRECKEEFGTLNTPKAIIGLGPFILEEYVVNTRMVYKKNPDYYRANEGLPYLDGLHYTNITDASTSLAAFRAEKIDIRGVSRIDLASVKKTNPNIYCYEGEVSLTEWAIAFRTDKAPFSDVNMRRAVSMAIDRQAIINSSLLGYGVEQLGPIHVMSPWYLADPVKDPAAWGECLKYERYNPEEAKRLMAEAGYPGGLSVSLTMVAGTEESSSLIVDFLTKVGIKATMKPLELTAYMSVVYSKKSYDDLVYVQEWGGGTFGPDSWVVQMYRKGYVSNYSNVDDPELEKMLTAQEGEMNPVKRQEILNDIQRYCTCQMQYVHWPTGWGVTCWQPWVRDYIVHAVTYHSGRIAERIWLTEDAPGRKVK